MSSSSNAVVQRPTVTGQRDVVGLIGVEPHLNWRTYVDAIITVASCDGLRGSRHRWLGSRSAPPHSDSSGHGQHRHCGPGSRLGLSQPSYQGITGVAGVLNAELEARDIPSISLRVGIPHYLDERRAPDGRRSSRRHLGHVLDVPTSEWMGGDISNQID